MTGFIRGLFGSRKNETDAGSGAKPKNSGAYYLTPDEAKTYGDIDYMRTAKTVKRTFPKGDPRVRQVSSEQDSVAASDVPNSTPPAQNQSFRPSAPPAKTSAPPTGATERRKPDNSMDMFRNMAKDIRKR